MKILIFGRPGSGKTTLAQRLAERLDLPLFHIDKHFFESGWVERDKNAFLRDVELFMHHESWIIDGNAMRSLESRYKEASIAIYCHLPRGLCLYRLLKRMVIGRGKPKVDGPVGSTNSITWRLFRYMWNFQKRYSEKVDSLKEQYPNVLFFDVSTKEEQKKAEAMLGGD